MPFKFDMLRYNIDNPDCRQHYIYRRRCDRALIVFYLLLAFSYIVPFLFSLLPQERQVFIKLTINTLIDIFSMLAVNFAIFGMVLFFLYFMMRLYEYLRAGD
jgi:hypothetical protein